MLSIRETRCAVFRVPQPARPRLRGLHSFLGGLLVSGRVKQSVGYECVCVCVCHMRTETAKLLPASLGRWRTDKKYSPYKDIRKNLFQKYDNDVYSPDDTPTCADVSSYILIYALRIHSRVRAL